MKNKNCKYIFVTGGVLSGVGKGITTASIGAILKDKGLAVSVQKCDPYLNVDAGQLHPLEHGECFVTRDGAETDLDLGHYERFLDVELTRKATTLSGAIFWELLEKERAGKFGGKTIQMLPHFTNLVQEKIAKASEGSDVHIVEIGGTVGDYESLAFIEAIRLFANRVGRRNCLYVSVVYVPWINTSKELKTKPAQNALRDLRGFGIIPDVVCVRTEEKAPKEICEKIANFSGVEKEAVVNLPDIESVYDVPLNILKSGVLSILDDFTGNTVAPKMRKWKEFSRKRKELKAGDGKEVRVGLVTKCLGNEDIGLSIIEAVKTAGIWQGVKVKCEWVGCDAEGRVDEAEFAALKLSGVIEIEGFGRFGEKSAVRLARKQGLPYLGLGRDEGEKCLGERGMKLTPQSLPTEIYGEMQIVERMRYRYEMSEAERQGMEEMGAKVVGKTEGLPVVIAGEKMIMMQARPEYKARPLRPQVMFEWLVKEMKARE